MQAPLVPLDHAGEIICHIPFFLLTPLPATHGLGVLVGAEVLSKLPNRFFFFPILEVSRLSMRSPFLRISLNALDDKRYDGEGPPPK